MAALADARFAAPASTDPPLLVIATRALHVAQATPEQPPEPRRRSLRARCALPDTKVQATSAVQADARFAALANTDPPQLGTTLRALNVAQAIPGPLLESLQRSLHVRCALPDTQAPATVAARADVLPVLLAWDPLHQAMAARASVAKGIMILMASRALHVT